MLGPAAAELAEAEALADALPDEEPPQPASMAPAPAAATAATEPATNERRETLLFCNDISFSSLPIVARQMLARPYIVSTITSNTINDIVY